MSFFVMEGPGQRRGNSVHPRSGGGGLEAARLGRSRSRLHCSLSLGKWLHRVCILEWGHTCRLSLWQE